MGDSIQPEDLFAEHKEDLPEEWHDTFDQLTGQGKSPSGIKATIEYVTTTKTQQEVALEYNISEVTIRSIQTAVVALGPIDYRQPSTHSGGRESSVDHCTYIADALGWEEGVEYSITDNTYGSGQRPRLLVEGWRSLREEVTDGILNE